MSALGLGCVKTFRERSRTILSRLIAGLEPHLKRAERVLDSLAALAHGLRVLVETPLRRLQYMFVLPAVMRRSLPVVQRCLIAQVPQALVQ